MSTGVSVGAAQELERTPWVMRLLRYLRPRDGYLVLGLAWGAVISLPAAAIDGELLVGLQPVVWLATLALLFTWWLAERRLRGWLAALVLVLSGVLAVLSWGVHVLQPWPLLSQTARWSAWWLGRPMAPAPSLAVFDQQIAALADYGQRVGWWVSGLIGGRGMPDNLVVLGLAGLLCWAAAAWAAWWLVRRGLPFVALLPTGILLANTVYSSSKSYWTLVAYGGSLAALLVLLPMERQMRAWDRDGIDYSPEVRTDIALTALGLVTLVTILMPTLPFLTSREVSQAFWRRFENPYRQVEQQLSPSFEGSQPARSLAPASGVMPGGLPRAHLLGGRPELGQEVALRAQVRGALPDALLYWRGQTFAVYTGRGWEEDAPPAPARDFAAGAAWTTDPLPAARRSLLVSVRVLAASRVVIYAPGEPVSIDRPYRARLRGPGELVALQDRAGGSRYAVLSAVPELDANLLRAAGESYPDPIRAIYLQAPDNLPAELVAYAVELTAAAPPTPFDRALAIESALRQLPYSLDVPLPPAGRELVSWFLFDLRRGYCDYFATAMVVLARLNGIPARLAVGYVTGDRDARTDEYVVSERQAHAWPELYFPGYGWIPFEPTPAQAAPARPAIAALGAPVPYDPTGAGLSAGMAELQQLAAGEAAAQRRQVRLQGVLGGLNCLALMVGAIGGWAARRPRRMPGGAPPQIAASYDHLARWGARLGRAARSADTPREYAAAVIGAADALVAHASPARAGAIRAAAVVRDELPAWVEAYESATYGPETPPRDASQVVAELAGRRRLWPALRRVWLARVISRTNVK